MHQPVPIEFAYAHYRNNGRITVNALAIDAIIPGNDGDGSCTIYLDGGYSYPVNESYATVVKAWMEALATAADD